MPAWPPPDHRLITGLITGTHTMPLYTFRLPDIGEGIAEAEIVAWHVAVGDQVAEDGRLADVMTDKATVEMES
ncbi:biotin/lipoyl-containing protein, partial [Enterococcus faecalis]|uniref:biotin/lipoyl-containing protein n=1 Tax=Enterococcus faecalis TaxID=1351 RepID=UPI00403F6867